MSDGKDKITREEMAELFGERMPIEAVALLWDADNETTVGELRQKLRKAAREHKKSSMTDLLARLNACYVELNEDGLPCGYGDPLNPDGPEAADALTAQQAEIERLREALDAIAKSPVKEWDRERVDLYATGMNAGRKYCANIARAALTGKEAGDG